MSDVQTPMPWLPGMLPADIPVVLLLRHAARPPLVEGESGADLPITREGEAASALLGEQLGSSLRSLRTSPVRRCQETAVAIIRGAGHVGEPTDDRLLGDPGIYVTEPELAWKGWESRGHEGMLLHLASGGEALPGFAEPVEATHALRHYLFTRAHPDPGLHVAITHDALMISMLAALLHRPLARSEWPEFLEGLALWQQSGRAWLAYHGTIQAINP